MVYLVGGVALMTTHDPASDFANHVAEYSEAEVGRVRVERLVWRQPGTNNYRVDYACIGGSVLCVCGDLGEAVYNAGGQSLAWWARCDRSYFAGKCMASEYGRGYKDWDDDRALSRFREEIARMRADGEEIDADLVDEAELCLAGGRGEWEAWMRESAHELFGDDWWDFVPNFGVVIAQRCELHLIGLKLAIAQLDERRAQAMLAAEDVALEEARRASPHRFAVGGAV